MQTQNLNAAHSLYVIYETLSAETQQVFLQELLEKHTEQIESLLTLLEPINNEAVLLSEQALVEDWLKPEEDKAWAHLSKGAE
jgi:hypothetical protein